MRHASKLRIGLHLALAFAAWLAAGAALAKNIGADPAPCCACGQCGYDAEFPRSPQISPSQGNLTETVEGPRIHGSAGDTLSPTLQYDSYNADGSRAQIDSGLGYGWTHSYNVYLFRQLGHVFRMDGSGRVTKYRRGPTNCAGTVTYFADPGHFETLVQNLDGSFTLTQKDRKRFRFQEIPNTPFLVKGPILRLTQIVDRNGNTTALSYVNGNPTSVTDPYGRSLTFAYDAQNRLASIADPLGRTTSFFYGPTGRELAEIRDAEGRSVRYAYDFQYRLARKVDRDGRVTSYRYANGMPVGVDDGSGDAVFTYANPLNWGTDPLQLSSQQQRRYLPSVTTMTDGRGNQWEYEYDASGYIVRIRAPDGATRTYGYDATVRKVASITDANGNTTSFAYDANGNPLARTDALGHTTAMTYEPVFNNQTSTTDPNGRTTSYSYDASGNRTQEVDPLGSTRIWTYGVDGNVLTRADKNGNVTSYGYDGAGNRISETDALGGTATTTYDGVGTPTSRTDRNGNVTSYLYDGLDRRVRETDPAGSVSETAYDGNGNLVQEIDRNGNVTRYEYDQRERPIRTIDALGNTTETTYDGNDNPVSRTDAEGRVTTYQYDAQNRRIQSIDALGQPAGSSYDAVGNRLSETDANGRTTQYAYDALRRPVSTTDPVGAVTSVHYDGAGLPGCAACSGPTRGSDLPTRVQDGEGRVIYYEYDGLDRPILEIRKQVDSAHLIDPDDAVTARSYDANGNLLGETDPNGNPLAASYDPLDRRVQEINGAGDVTVFGYDPGGNRVTEAAPSGNTIRYAYDALDRVVEVQDSMGLVTRYGYDAVGNRLTQADANGNTTTTEYDPVHRVSRITDPLGGVTTHAYDAVGNRIQTTDRDGHVSRYAYDGLDRLTQTTDALGNAVQRDYDAVGNTTRVVDQRGNATEYQYDGRNRRIRETFADGAVQTYGYDLVGNRLTRTDPGGRTTGYAYDDLDRLVERDYPVGPDDHMSYDLGGRMQSAERGGWTVTFAYDGADRLVQTLQNGRTLSYAYDVPGRRRTLTHPGGRTIVEESDLRGRLEEVRDPSVAPAVLARYAYDAADRVLTRSYRNGAVARYGYDANDRLTQVRHEDALAALFAGFAYAHAPEGQPAFEENLASPARSEAYLYDALHRLIEYRVGTLVGSSVPLPVTQTSYDLDPVGNWSHKTTDSITQSRSHDAVNELIQIDAESLDYDANGNLGEDALYRYAYDEENRLIRVTHRSDLAVVGEYHYDALGRRVRKIANASGTPAETRYFYDGLRAVEEQDAAGATLATYVHGDGIDEVLTMDRGGSVFYYHENAQGSVEALSDAAAAIVERYAYDAYGCPAPTDGAGTPVPPNAWGTPHSAIGNPHLFTGRELDEETGLYHYRARAYDCAKGRFLQRDPLESTEAANEYEYVKSRPTFEVDPLGLQSGPTGRLASAWTQKQEWYTRGTVRIGCECYQIALLMKWQERTVETPTGRVLEWRDLRYTAAQLGRRVACTNRELGELTPGGQWVAGSFRPPWPASGPSAPTTPPAAFGEAAPAGTEAPASYSPQMLGD